MSLHNAYVIECDICHALRYFRRDIPPQEALVEAVVHGWSSEPEGLYHICPDCPPPCSGTR